MNSSCYIIPHDKREIVIREALELSHWKTVEELDCTKSFARKPSSKTIEEVIEIGLNDSKTLFHFIYRHSAGFHAASFDVGLSTMCRRPDYFLWISLTLAQGIKLIRRHNLKTLE